MCCKPPRAHTLMPVSDATALPGVARAVLGSGVPFGILPQGTFNFFGRAHGIPQDAHAATRCLFDARIEPVQVGLLNDRLFLVNASLGLYPQLLEDREAYKQRYGRSRMVALWSGLVTLLRAPPQLTLQLEHGGQARTLRTPTLVVGNNALQLERLGIAEAAALQQGQLVAMSVRPVGTLALYGLLLSGLFSRLGEADKVVSFGFDRLTVRVRGRRRVKVAMDGEISWLPTPLQFQVSPEPLRLLVPSPGQRLEAA
ncbi:Putative lipid kinase BmrU [Bordetella pertussis]|nr:Putative lipid kinase BmrU [Bordetella pertussis]